MSEEEVAAATTATEEVAEMSVLDALKEVSPRFEFGGDFAS
jgi:hypothetical protein